MGIFPTLRQLLKSKLWRRFSPFSQADAVPHLGETLKFKVKCSQAFEQLAKTPNQEFQEVQM